MGSFTTGIKSTDEQQEKQSPQPRREGEQWLFKNFCSNYDKKSLPHNSYLIVTSLKQKIYDARYEFIKVRFNEMYFQVI